MENTEWRTRVTAQMKALTPDGKLVTLEERVTDLRVLEFNRKWSEWTPQSSVITWGRITVNLLPDGTLVTEEDSPRLLTLVR